MSADKKDSSGTTYKDAGVDIEAGAALVENIKTHVRSTNRPGADTEIGGFGGLFDLAAAGFNDPVLVAATDGVGTKLKLALETGIHDTVGIDLVAMCVNDLVVQGAEPLFFLDYFATGKLDPAGAEQVIKGIAEGCRQAGCALIGGETAEMPGMYAPGDYDLAGFAVGAAERGNILTGAEISPGDALIALGSSGVHSNGYSLVRKIVSDQGLGFGDDCPFGPGTLGAALLTPTRIYVKPCLEAHRAGVVKGFAHITGGGLIENVPRILPDGMAVSLDASAWDTPGVFNWLSKTGNISSSEMALTFNCGVGMVVVTPADKAQQAIDIFTQAGERAVLAGEVVAETGGERVRIEGLSF